VDAVTDCATAQSERHADLPGQISICILTAAKQSRL
jgi:hypothetical protein